MAARLQSGCLVPEDKKEINPQFHDNLLIKITVCEMIESGSYSEII